MTGPGNDPIVLLRPGWVSTQLAARLAWLLVIIGAAFLSTGQQQHARFTALAVEFVVILVVAAVSRLYLRRRGAPPPITLGPEVVTLPRNAASRRTVLIPYAKVRSATVMGSGRRARLIVDTASGAFVYPLRAFAAPDAAVRLVAQLRARVEALPDGAAQWSRIAARNALAGELAGSFAWVTAATAVLLGVCFLAEMAVTKGDLALRMVDAGANAGLLVRDGEWFRLVSASLLHLSPNHLIGNCLMLVVLGVMLERLIGHRLFLVVLLAAALASQAASAVYAVTIGGALYAIGASGAIFGILGVLAVVTWRYRHDLPGGYRLSARVWIFLVGINMILLPLLQKQTDKAAHGAGLAAGLLLGFALIWGCGHLRDVRRRQTGAASAVLGALALVWVAGIGAALRHGARADARAADRITLAHDMLDSTLFAPAVQNLVAWDVATDAHAPRTALSDARLLAHRGVAEAARLDGVLVNRAARAANANVLSAITDTEASLDFRLGYPAQAAALEADISGRPPEIMAHMMQFLERVGTADDAGAAWPSVALDHGIVRLTVKAAAPRGAEIYALLHRHGALTGMMLVRVPPGFSGTQVLPLPVRRHGPSPVPPEALWLDGGTELSVARYDASSCHCGNDPVMGPFYTAYDPHFAALPP